MGLTRVVWLTRPSNHGASLMKQGRLESGPLQSTVWSAGSLCRMGWSFRRSINIGPLKVNLSKSGVGYSVGTRGFRIGKDAKGRAYSSLSIPGTGIYRRDYQQNGRMPPQPQIGSHSTHDELNTAFLSTSQAFSAARDRWKNGQRVPESFETTKQRLREQRDELASLPAMRQRREVELRSALRQKQLIRFLERHRLEDASLPGIGSGRKTLLRCYGVDDAGDVHANININGIGPTLLSTLLNWRRSIERRFVFNPNQEIDPIDIRTLDHELAQKKAALVRSLSAGPQVLRQILAPWQTERVSVAANISHCAKAVAQAEVNLRYLGRF